MSKPDFTPCAYTMKMQAQKAQSRLEEANKRIEQLERRNAELEELLRELSIEYECDIRHRFIGLIDVPSEREVTRRAFDSDMDIVKRVDEQLRKEQEK